MRLLYDLFNAFYRLALLIFSRFNSKAKLLYNGRRDVFRKWQSFNSDGKRVIWFHCASLGEFEQGRPVIEAVRERHKELFVLLTFFSPSGYEIRKDYPFADAVCYLPADTFSNTRRFLEIFKPEVAVFVKYEFWYHFLSGLKGRGTPLYLISANFRPGQIFFRWYGGWFRNMLHLFSHIFVQDETSRQLLESAGVGNVTVSGDTRFDRVTTLVSSRREIPPAKVFSEGSFTIVAGSTWNPDNSLLITYMNETRHRVKLIIAPHEIKEDEIRRLALGFTLRVVLFSTAEPDDLKEARVMIIDNIGMLSSLYAYGSISYIGGGFGKGIHNILEAATYSIPVIFGPGYSKFREATDLVEIGGAFPVCNYDEFCRIADRLFADGQLLKSAGRTAGDYVKSGVGATNIIVDKILIS